MGRSPRVSPRTGVLTLVAGLTAASSLLWAYRPVEITANTGPTLPWWLLAPLFALSEIVVLHVQIRREAQTISLSEIPLVLALMLATPAHMLVAVTLGSAAVYILYRRQSPLKALFNTSLRVFGVSLMLFVLHVTTGPDLIRPRAWLATLLAVALAAAADGLLVQIVVAMHEGTFQWAQAIREVLRYPPIASVVGSLGVLFVIALRADVRAAPMLIVLCGAGFLSFRAHASLNDEHLSLERLYDFGRRVAASHESDDIVAGVLASARTLARAEVAEVVLRGLPGRGDRRWVLAAGSDLPSDQPLRGGDDPALWRDVLDDGTPLLVARDKTGRDSLQLSKLGYREAIVVPLGDEGQNWGTLLVADRMGEVRAFRQEDVPLLETVGTQASLALANARLLDRLRHESQHDVLTGLANRAKFRSAVEQALKNLDQGTVEGCAVMLLDLDGFKEVNDSLGHHCGDELLIHVASCLTHATGTQALAARLGGDEFAVLLPDTATAAGARAMADRIQETMSHVIVMEGIEVQVRGSLGIAMAPSHAVEASALLKCADAAMYAAKTSGGGSQLYAERLGETTSGPSTGNTVALLAELRRALTEGEIYPFVQPQARTSTGHVVGIEALVRWNHPQRGLLAPLEFLALAERHGLMYELTKIVLDRSVEAAAAWRALGLDLRVSVNLPVQSLMDARIVATVTSTLRRHCLPAADLTLEITEDCVMSDPDQALTVLNSLRSLGVRLSVDDFGTGYSSLSYLRRLPIQEVKIDRSFIASISRNAQDLVIARSIIDLGANLGLEVVAEGVEDQDSWNHLADLGCHFVQGYHLARPMPIEELAPWLEGYNTHQRTLAASASQVPRPRLHAIQNMRRTV